MKLINTVLIGDARDKLSVIPDKIANMCVTSPPYYQLRDYGAENQIGMENTPESFINNLVDVFRQVKRILKDDGTLWINIGDTYYGGNTQPGGGSHNGKHIKSGTPPKKQKVNGLKPKDLIGIPWMLAFALRADGWYLRQDIIWSKPNPMPESVIDRCTKSHEYIFMLSKSPKYYYDSFAIRTPMKESSVSRLAQNIDGQKGSSRVPGKTNGTMKAVGGDKQRGHGRRHAGFNGRWDALTKEQQCSLGANKRSVWNIATKPFKEAHFATFPQELIVDCIKAGCPEEGIILDPFFGAGTTGLVARKLNRNFIGCELNAGYVDISQSRMNKELGLFK